MKFPIPDDWDGESWCRWAVCWPQSERWEGLLRGLLTLPQRGRTWDERTGTITEVQTIGRQIAEYNLPLVGVVMACNDTELATAFSDIALSIRYLADRQQLGGDGCCAEPAVIVNNTIQGHVTQPVGGNLTPIYGSQPPLSVDEGEFPPGFDNLDEYLGQKCQNAVQIVNGIILTLRGLGAITVFNITALTGLILLSLSPAILFPPSAIPIAIGALIVLSVAMHYLDAAADAIESDHSTLVCILFQSDSAETAIALVADFMDGIIVVIGALGPLGTAVKLILMLLCNSDTLNALFENRAALDNPDADCSGCAPCEELFYEFELGAEGFAEVGSLPSCFGLTLNGSADLTTDGGVLFVNVSGGAPNPNGAFGKIGVAYDVREGSNIQVGLRMSGAGSLYIDYVIEFDDSSCLWATLSNNDPASSVFHGISNDVSAHAGKSVENLYFFVQSANAGPDESFLVEFENIGFFCD